MRIFDFNEVMAERRRASAPVAELVNVVASDSDRPVSPALLRAGSTSPDPSLARRGKLLSGASAQLAESASGTLPPRDRSAWSAPCPTTRLRRSWSTVCLMMTSKPCTRFARRWRDEHLGRWFTVPKLSGFCLLMKRAVYDKIGGLDERFGIGFFDDDDLAERARRAGFELAVAHDLFVHHFGSRSFTGNGIDAEALLNRNAQRFAAKWGLAETGGRRVALQPFTVGPRALRDRRQDGSQPRSRNEEGNRPQMTQMDADNNAGVLSDFGSETGPIAEAKPQEAASWSDSPAPSCRLLSHLRPSESSADNDLLSFSSHPANRFLGHVSLGAQEGPRLFDDDCEKRAKSFAALPRVSGRPV